MKAALFSSFLLPQVFSVSAQVTIVKTWKHICPSTDEEIKETWNIIWNIMEYYSATKKNKIMLFAATWMDLESIMLNEVRQRKMNIR